MEEKSSEVQVKEPTGYGNQSTISGIRIIVAFWLLGMCNNYIYVIMLSAAHDVITRIEGKDHHESNFTSSNPSFDPSRNCTDLTTGAILLADIVPTLAVKILFPFLPFFVHIRLIFAIVAGALSLVLVASSKSIVGALVGVCFASFNCGLGELTLLAYSTNYIMHAIAGWSSGTGGAGLVGSFAYAGMTEAGLSPESALFVSLCVPALMAVAFWIILMHPPESKHFCSSGDTSKEEKLTFKVYWQTLKEQIVFFPELLPYMIPVGLVYYFEYVINSALFEHLVFLNTSMDQRSQFRWYNVMYQVGVFISRSSVTWIHFKKVWIMSVLQSVNVVIFTFEAVRGYIPNIWVAFALIFWEGLLGGAAYVNTFYNMSCTIDKNRRLFALSIASVADTVGIVSAGLTSFIVHDSICSLPYNPVSRS